jgi:hypothetical protein
MARPPYCTVGTASRTIPATIFASRVNSMAISLLYVVFG